MALTPAREHTILTICHVLQFSVIAAVLGISAYRMMNPGLVTSRNDTMVMGIAAKGLVIMAYMIYTEKCQNLKKWSSIKANFILSCTEVVFWAAGAIIPFMNVSNCIPGLGCYLVYIMIGLAAVNCQLAIAVCWITWRHWQFFKRNGVMPGNGKGEQIKDEYNLEAGSTHHSVQK
ncbi:hypothetical protein HYFRA_00007242 [Hymenoscyphus fraxineus]|uniref:Uncharacterized protein n=1 Tax=Hymenoscyphus fraxineus TaxID=746836 RepID=A0A9N9KVS1_9HELO|nr:hypothetical protein HYFRA_00007242 [Hymenoscyphus fraxineus]